MTFYLGFTGEAGCPLGGVDELAIISESETEARSAIEQAQDLRRVGARPEKFVSAAEQRAVAESGFVTSTGHFTDRLYPARPKAVEWVGGDWASMLRIETGGTSAVSHLSLVDDGDWRHHWEWSEWENAQDE